MHPLEYRYKVVHILKQYTRTAFSPFTQTLGRPHQEMSHEQPGKNLGFCFNGSNILVHDSLQLLRIP